jgi:hypothetical protein
MPGEILAQPVSAQESLAQCWADIGPQRVRRHWQSVQTVYLTEISLPWANLYGANGEMFIGLYCFVSSLEKIIVVKSFSIVFASDTGL